jgi:hypothetical protein
VIYILVTGSRDWDKPEAIHKDLNRILRDHGPDQIMIVTGYCVNTATFKPSGADKYAMEWAIENEIPFLSWPARWRAATPEDKRRQGPIRNKRMISWLWLLKEWLPPQSTSVAAFAYPKGKSSGTRGTIKLLGENDILYFKREYEDV